MMPAPLPAMRIALACGAMLLGACATRPVDRNAPRIVDHLDVAPYAMHEDCLLLNSGERLDFHFESTEPLHFDLRYRDAGAVVQPMVRDGARDGGGIYPVPATRSYCLSWEAGAAGARLGYRYTVHPATP